jgi:hypothetical protein
MIGKTIAFALGNFTLTFFVVGLLFSAFGLARAPKPISRASVIESLLSWFVFWTIGRAVLLQRHFPCLLRD